MGNDGLGINLVFLFQQMTEKARHALSQGLIWTSSHEAACGVTLKPTRYLIAGKYYTRVFFLYIEELEFI